MLISLQQCYQELRTGEGKAEKPEQGTREVFNVPVTVGTRNTGVAR